MKDSESDLDDLDKRVERIKQGDEQALAQYIADHHQQLGRFLRTITGEHLLKLVEIDDLIQEVSAAAINGLASAPLDQYEPMQWLQHLARRRVVDAHRFHFDAKRRDAGRRQSIHGAGNGDASGFALEQMLVASMTSASAVVSRDHRMIRVQQAITELSEQQQMAIRLRYAEGLSTKEVAEKIGKTDVATRVLLSRSMRRLEEVLADVKPTR